MLDGLSLLVVALKVKNAQSVQVELMDQANQNEIAQGDVVITETVVISDSQNNEDGSQVNN